MKMDGRVADLVFAASDAMGISISETRSLEALRALVVAMLASEPGVTVARVVERARRDMRINPFARAEKARVS